MDLDLATPPAPTALAPRIDGNDGVLAGLEVVAAQRPALLDLARQGADRFGLPRVERVSGAGHDAVYVARTAPTAMIFLPCDEVGGARPEPLEAGAKVMLARAGRA